MAFSEVEERLQRVMLQLRQADGMLHDEMDDFGIKQEESQKPCIAPIMRELCAVSDTSPRLRQAPSMLKGPFFRFGSAGSNVKISLEGKIASRVNPHALTFNSVIGSGCMRESPGSSIVSYFEVVIKKIVPVPSSENPSEGLTLGVCLDDGAIDKGDIVSGGGSWMESQLGSDESSRTLLAREGVYLIGFDGRATDGESFYQSTWTPSSLSQGDRVGVAVSRTGVMVIVVNGRLAARAPFLLPRTTRLIPVVELLGNCATVSLTATDPSGLQGAGPNGILNIECPLESKSVSIDLRGTKLGSRILGDWRSLSPHTRIANNTIFAHLSPEGTCSTHCLVTCTADSRSSLALPRLSVQGFSVYIKRVVKTSMTPRCFDNDPVGDITNASVDSLMFGAFEAGFSLGQLNGYSPASARLGLTLRGVQSGIVVFILRVGRWVVAFADEQVVGSVYLSDVVKNAKIDRALVSGSATATAQTETRVPFVRIGLIEPDSLAVSCARLTLDELPPEDSMMTVVDHVRSLAAARIQKYLRIQVARRKLRRAVNMVVAETTRNKDPVLRALDRQTQILLDIRRAVNGSMSSEPSMNSERALSNDRGGTESEIRLGTREKLDISEKLSTLFGSSEEDDASSVGSLKELRPNANTTQPTKGSMSSFLGSFRLNPFGRQKPMEGS